MQAYIRDLVGLPDDWQSPATDIMKTVAEIKKKLVTIIISVNKDTEKLRRESHHANLKIIPLCLKSATIGWRIYLTAFRWNLIWNCKCTAIDQFTNASYSSCIAYVKIWNAYLCEICCDCPALLWIAGSQLNKFLSRGLIGISRASFLSRKFLPRRGRSQVNDWNTTVYLLTSYNALRHTDQQKAISNSHYKRLYLSAITQRVP